MNKHQGFTWELLIILGLVALFVSPVGTWLGSIVYEISQHHDISLTFNPFDKRSTTFSNSTGTLSGGTFTNTSSSDGTSSGLVHSYNIPLQGGGAMTVNANSQQAAIQNVQAEGGTPAAA